ncbi:MAG: histidine phosphatase family protein [Chitinophagaceae bacterium]
MKTLLLVRHAKSSWDNASVADFDRPLNARGQKNADEMASRLLLRVPAIDAFISSPAKRAKATALQFAAAYNYSTDEIIFEKGLYLAPASFFSNLIAGIDNNFNSIAIFSHNPGITDFANSLATAVTTDNIPTCGIFAVKAEVDNWGEFANTARDLLFYDYPKLQE